MTTNKVSSESSFYFQLIHVNNVWNIKTVFMQYGYRLQWYGIFPLFLIQYLAQLGLLRIPMGKKQTHSKTPQTRAKRSALSQQVTTRYILTDAYKGIANTSQKKTIKDPQKKYCVGTVSKIFYWRA